MSTIYMCRWATCRLEFKEEERYKEHVNSHIEALQPMLVSNMPSYRLASGFGPSSSAPQPGFDHLNTQESLHTAASPPEISKIKMPARKGFSALGLGGQATPPMSPLIPSPSMSTQIRGSTSPARRQTKAGWSPPSPIQGLASSVVNSGPFATPSEMAFSPIIPQNSSGRNEEAGIDDEASRTPAAARSQTPEGDAPAENSRKRKQSVMFNEPTTPANKKKKKNPKTPFPDPDLDSSDEDGDDSGPRLGPDELDALADHSTADPYLIFTQAPGSSWDELETPEEDLAASFFLQETNRTEGAFIEEVDEEIEVASQLRDSNLRVEDVTSSSA